MVERIPEKNLAYLAGLPSAKNDINTIATNNYNYPVLFHNIDLTFFD